MPFHKPHRVIPKQEFTCILSRVYLKDVCVLDKVKMFYRRGIIDFSPSISGNNAVTNIEAHFIYTFDLKD